MRIDTLPSTAVGPAEVFQCAGTAWNAFVGEELRSYFDVTMASVDGGLVHCAAPMVVTPASSVAEIERTDVVFIPTGGADLEQMLERHAPLVPWLERQHEQGANIAQVCTGIAFAAATGLLDLRPSG